MLKVIEQKQDGRVAPVENGFAGHANNILGDLNSMRRDTPFVNMSLGEYLPYWEYETGRTKNLDTGSDNRRKLVRDFFLSLGILDVGEVTVKNLTGKRNDNATWLFPELVRAAIEIGIGEGPVYPNIVAEKQRVAGERTAVMPTLRVNQNVPEELGEDSTMPEATVTYGSRDVSIYPKGLSIKFTYDALAGMKMRLVQKFLQSQGQLMGLALDADAIRVLISGDQENGSQNAAVIGIENTTTGLQYRDLIRVFAWMAGQSHKCDTMIVSFQEAVEVFDMNEFKLKNQQGTVQIQAKSNMPVPSNLNIFAKSNMPEGKILMLDSKKALVEFDAEPLLVETDRLIFDRIQGTALSMRVGFANLYRTARVVLDLGHAYSEDDYNFDHYDWFTPLDSVPLS